MRRVLLASILLMLSFQSLVFAQRDSLRTLFLDAESWFLFEEYADALPLYQALLENDPGNDNLNYKIGICLLNDPYQKDKAIQYLLDASENINPDYKGGHPKERTAPPDALYHLGNAYLVNELLNHAIESYEEFLEVMDPDVYDAELVKAQIQSCKNAQRLKTMPVDIDLTLQDEIVNTRYSDVRPVISGDGTKMAFVTELPFYDGAFFTEKTEDGWSYPQIITQMLGFDEDIYPVSLSYDGSEMILYYDDDYIGSLYYSRYVDGLWTPAVKLEENISTKFWESHASFSKDGQTLYFTSNRKGTYGGLDIYVSGRKPDGSWGPAVNLGPTINSPYNEESPCISEDGNTLYFSSYGHYNMGGYDIFYSKRGPDGAWGEPVNIGYPINTTDNDLYFQPIRNGNAAYYSLYSPRGIGRHDIYLMDIYSVNNPRYYPVSGTLRTGDGRLDSTQIAIYVVDSEMGDTLLTTPPGQDGGFGFELTQGMYALHISGPGYEDLIRPLRITPESNKEGIRLSDNLILDPVLEEGTVRVFEGEESQIQLREDSYEGVAGESLEVPIRAPRGSTVFVEVYQDSVLVDSDTLVMDRRRDRLEIVPLPGRSEVEITMTDEEGNLHRNRFTVTGTLPEIPDVQEEVPQEEQGTSLKDPLPEAAAALLLIEQADQVSGGDVEVLKQELSDHSEGALKEYMDQMDPQKEGISNVEEFLIHLEEAADSEGFTLEEVSQAMIDSLEADAKAEDLVSLVSKLHQEAEGNLKTELQMLSLEKEGISGPKQLFEHLYSQAEASDYHKNEVDAMLSDVLAHGDAELLKQQLIENSQGALKEYLQQLDLEAEGITKAGELLRHLEEVAEAEGFDMDAVRKAMLEGLEQPLEVDLLFEELLESSEGEIREILKELDLRKEGIYITEELVEVLIQKLIEKGYSKEEIEAILSELLPGQMDLIQELGEKYIGDAGPKGGLGWALILIFTLAGAGIIWFIILWWRRRDKKNEEEK